MLTLLTNKTFLAGVATGFVIGTLAYKHFATEKGVDGKDLAKSLMSIAGTVTAGKVMGGAAGGLGRCMMK